jgi:DNA repair exonuclease SbcCD ATPase subunit
MPEPLTFKIITDADDSGIKRYEKGMDGLNVSSRKTSAAINSLSRELLQAKSGADIASASAESLAHIFHQGIAGAVIIGGVKLVSDQIKGMGELVRGVGEETASAVKQLQRMGQPSNLQEAVKGVDMLDQKLDAVTKKLEGIQQGNWFAKLLAQVTGTTQELKAQEETLTRLRDAQIALGFAVEVQNAQSLEGLNAYQKGLEQNNLKLQERLVIAERITDTDLKAKAIQDAYRLSVIEANEFETKIEKQREEAQQKLNDLLQKRIDLQDQLAKAQQNEIIRQGELATLSAGIGGTSRGPGQNPTSFEIGLQKAADRAYQDQKRQEQEKQDKIIENELKAQGKANGKQDVQREKVRRAEEAAREKAKKEFEDPYKKQIEKTAKALQDNEIEINKQSNAIQDLGGSASSARSSINSMGSAAGDAASKLQSLASAIPGSSPRPFRDEFLNPPKGGKTLTDVYMLLEKTLDELKSYAHVK